MVRFLQCTQHCSKQHKREKLSGIYEGLERISEKKKSKTHHQVLGCAVHTLVYIGIQRTRNPCAETKERDWISEGSPVKFVT